MQALTTIEYADAYFESKLNIESWDKADESTKNKLLCEATRRIYSIQGFKYTPQAIELLTAVPDDLQQACCEIALNIADIGVNNPHVINQKLGIKAISFGKDSVSYGDNNTIQSNVFNDYAMSLLNKYIIKAVPFV